MKGECEEVVTIKKHQKLLPCETQPVPASPKMDLPLAKAGPISDADSASVIIYLRKGKKNIGESQL